MTESRLERSESYWRGTFSAMASPCEVLIDTDVHAHAAAALDAARAEAWRIERAFSRYRNDNLIHAINNANGRPVVVDEELAGLIDFADTCYHLSEGRFDITSGGLRQVWRFDGRSSAPTPSQVEDALSLVGWGAARWSPPHLTLPVGMEIDLGGIGKEYAVDTAAARAREAAAEASVVVNFGGDLRATGVRRDGRAWQVGIERPGLEHEALLSVDIRSGGVATSGDARRYVMHNGRRLSHILDPRTGWPVKEAPRSVTVVADRCLDAGIMSTLAMLHGADAESFLDAQEVRYWCVR